MPVFIFKKAVYTALFLLFTICSAYAQRPSDIASPNIVVNLPSRTLELYSGETFVKEYPIAIGKTSTPTPLGKFSIIDMEINPVWIPPRQGYIVESGPDNPLGYRWMGFLPLYGIHGTNAPWSIGMAVSNGCIRMREEDAEELFEVITYGTPVRVIYDRVKVRVDSNGQATIGVYPDIYGYKQVTLSDVYNKLVEYGLAGFVTEDFLQNLLNQPSDKQVPFAKLYALKVNDKVLPEKVVLASDVLYVPVWAIAGQLKTNIVWDEHNQQIKGEKRSVPGVVKNDILYVTSDDLQMLFGGQQALQEDEGVFKFNVLSVFVNGRLITHDVQLIDGLLTVPVLTLAEAFGVKVNWDAAKGFLMIDGRKVPINIISDQPYIKINSINEFFKAYVYWNEQGHTIELNYPSK